MCGIFGIASYGTTTYYKAKAFRKAARGLLEESQKRGSSASGICILTKEGAYVYKDNLPAKRLIQTAEYGTIMKELHHKTEFKALIGHTRAPTQGSPLYNVNNHPIVTDRIIGVHNGHISNDFVLFNQFRDKMDRKGEVDSEIIFQLIDYYRSEDKSLVESVKEAADKLIGGYACAFIDRKNPRYLSIFTNNKFESVSVLFFSTISSIVFASTKSILNKALEGNSGVDPQFATGILELKESGIRIDLLTGGVHSYKLEGKSKYGSHMSQACAALGYCQACDGDCANCEWF